MAHISATHSIAGFWAVPASWVRFTVLGDVPGLGDLDYPFHMPLSGILPTNS